MPSDEAEKFHLMVEVAKSALGKVPSTTPEILQSLSQPEDTIPPAEYLKRFVLYPQETLVLYQVGEVR